MNSPIQPSLSDVRIRHELQPGDLGAVAHLHGKLYASEYGYGLSFESYVLDGLHEFASSYDTGKDRVWVCEAAGSMVGFLLGLHRDEGVQLRFFLLLPEYRGMGLGKKLIAGFIDWATGRGYDRTFLWTTNEQQAAISLYVRNGFILGEQKASNAFGKELIELKYTREENG